MDKKNKIFFIVLFALIFGSIGATYLRIVVFKNYIVEAQADCDPETEKCFVWECDPNSTEEGEACTGDEENDIWYYQLIRRKAYNVPLCNPDEDESCLPMECDALTEDDCEIVFCDEETKIEQEVECSDPAEYLLNNPIEEDEEGEVEEEEEEEGEETEGETEEIEEVEEEKGEEVEGEEEEVKPQEVIN